MTLGRIDPNEFITLKAAIKAEMQRRKYTNSLAAYGGTAYDYTKTPAVGDAIYEEHYTKNIVPLQAANSTKVPDATMPRAVSQEDMDSMESFVAIMSARTNLADRSSSDCNGNCAGACSTACSTGCYTTCTGTCSGTCVATCANDCNYDCYGSCYGNCSGTCSGTCSGGCSGGCTNACTGACAFGCGTGCGGCEANIVEPW